MVLDSQEHIKFFSIAFIKSEQNYDDDYDSNNDKYNNYNNNDDDNNNSTNATISSFPAKSCKRDFWFHAIDALLFSTKSRPKRIGRNAGNGPKLLKTGLDVDSPPLPKTLYAIKAFFC